MPTYVQYQLVPPLTTASYGGGNIWVTEGRTYDVKAGLTAGSGTLLADVTDTPLLSALDRYPPLRRVGTTTIGTAPTVRYTLPLMATLTDPQPGDALQLNNDLRTAYNVPPAGTGGGPVQESDLDSALAAKINTRVPQGRVVTLGNLGAGQTVAITAADDQGQVDVFCTLNSDGVLTIDGVQTVTRCTVRVVASQDATGNHLLSVKNNFGGAQVAINVDPTPSTNTFIYCYTDDSTTLNVVGPDTSTVTGGSGGGIPAPTITGTLGGTNVLTANPPAILTSVSYQWKRDGADIAAATASTYTQVPANDAGHQITVRVTGTPTVVSDPVLIPSTNVSYVDTATQTTTTGTGLRVNRPAAATTGDVLFAVITVTTNSQTANGGAPVDIATPPTGWTLIARTNNASGPMTHFLYWLRVADATTFWTFTAGGSVTYRSRAVAFRNVLSSGTPYEVNTSTNGTFNPSVVAPAKTAGGTGRMYLVAVSFSSSQGITWPASTFTDPSGNDYQKFGYFYMGASTSFTAVTGTVVSGNQNKTISSLLILPGP